MPTFRSASQKESHNSAIAEALVQCRPLAQVARELRISRASVQRGVNTLVARWREEQAGKIADVKARDMAALDRMQWEAWQGWQRSIGKKIKRRVIDSDENGKTKLKEIIHDAGDHKFLDVILKCIEKRGQIAGYIERGEDAAPPQDIVIQIGQNVTLSGNDGHGSSHPS